MKTLKCTELSTNCGTFQVKETIEEAKKAVKEGGFLNKLSGRDITIKGTAYESEEKLQFSDEVKVYTYSEILMKIKK